MTLILKVLSILLGYPDEEMKGGSAELRDAVAGDRVLDPSRRHGLFVLIDELAANDLMDLQQRYVFLFDRTRSLSLHLFEHVHGESRDRGQAMVDLRAQYEAGGMEITANELPDYLPLFLEYLSLRPMDEARGLLRQTLHIVTAIRERLTKRGSPYAAVFEGLEALAQAKPDTEALEELRKAGDNDPDDLRALDRAWEDAPVTFGPGAASACPAERMETRFRAAIRAPSSPTEGGTP